MRHGHDGLPTCPSELLRLSKKLNMMRRLELQGVNDTWDRNEQNWRGLFGPFKPYQDEGLLYAYVGIHVRTRNYA